jgi:quinol-cytochrome oxidoreductase complex cytochrome b subunit
MMTAAEGLGEGYRAAVQLVDPIAMNRASAVLARLAAVAAGALIVTGAPLIFVYQPRGGVHWLSTLHALASMLFLGAAAGMLVTALAAAWARDSTWAGSALALAALAVAAGGAFTGQLIAWDMLGLRAVTVGDQYRGMLDAVGDDVRFVLVGGTEIAPDVLLRWTLVHVLVVPAVAIVVGRLLWARLRSWAAEESDGNQTADA